MPMLSYEEILRQLRKLPLPDQPPTPTPPPQPTPTGPYRPGGGQGVGTPPTTKPVFVPPLPGQPPPGQIVKKNPFEDSTYPGITPSPAVTSPAYKQTLTNDVPAEGKGLSLSLLFEAYQRNSLVPGGNKAAQDKALQDRLTAAAAAGEIKPEDVDIYKSLAQKLPANFSPTQLGAMMQKKLISPEDAKARLKEVYGDDDKANLMLQLLQKDAQKVLGVSDIHTALKNGQMTSGDALKRLTDEGYNDQDAKILLGSLAKTQTVGLSTLQNAFKRGEITQPELEKRLKRDYDLSPEDAALTLKDMTASTKAGMGVLTNLYHGNQVSDQETLDRLQSEQGYNLKDAQGILATMQQDKQKNAADLQYRDQSRAQSAHDRARSEADRVKSEARQVKSDAEREQAKEQSRIDANKQAPRMISDGVDGFLENFHRDLSTTLRDSNLGPEISNWAASNPDQVLTQSVGNGRKGAVLSGAAIANMYEGQRGMQRKNHETHADEITAQQIG